ncbi:thioredoxin [Porphyromonas crevioricanis]|uniref:Thioredoxin n=2 Tax=Porphyromonas crevioricanis TaxID=393921 RepID=A0A0A2G277_9PORP|nr:thioredoxin [Porphyromonas crevioricanis]KGN88763.1 thioredoxin [Porphyromonas crevioricanis]KGN96455.1 thioredoxin [Porphyromonas crevioricanis]SJZ94575.1 thioredoxin [Porphyromonas crevioricanis]SQH73621.1 Thioredoxin [Porphyromonas crevioricanis]GAD05471.1 thioredoxin [Porphyromonas crevioricanis JCM 15906]
MAMEITTQNYKELMAEGKPMVIDFWATWCGPCRMVGPIIDELSTEYEGKVIIGKVDVDENPDLAQEYGVRNIPTILFIKGGQVVNKLVGAQRKDALKQEIDALL